jgi:ribonuclease HII
MMRMIRIVVHRVLRFRIGNGIQINIVGTTTTTTITSSSFHPTNHSMTCTIKNDNNTYYCLIDGNWIPDYMPCSSMSIIGGDSKEYIIAMASIIAKVIRDRYMNLYDPLYPEYMFRQHKGYPTQQHRHIIAQLQRITPIHRRTFAPIKHDKYDSQTGMKIFSETTIVTGKNEKKRKS